MNSIEKREQITELLKIWERFTFMSQEEDWALQREKDARAGTDGARENGGAWQAAAFPNGRGQTQTVLMSRVRAIVGGDGDPLRCYCLENPMNREPGGLHKELDTTAAIHVLTHVYNLYLSIYDPLGYISYI